jgi:hypothetical protein
LLQKLYSTAYTFYRQLFPSLISLPVTPLPTLLNARQSNCNGRIQSKSLSEDAGQYSSLLQDSKVISSSAVGLPRIVDAQGDMIAGNWVPGGVTTKLASKAIPSTMRGNPTATGGYSRRASVRTPDNIPVYCRIPSSSLPARRPLQLCSLG